MYNSFLDEIRNELIGANESIEAAVDVAAIAQEAQEYAQARHEVEMLSLEGETAGMQFAGLEAISTFCASKETGLSNDAYHAVLLQLDNIMANVGGSEAVLGSVAAVESLETASDRIAATESIGRKVKEVAGNVGRFVMKYLQKMSAAIIRFWQKYFGMAVSTKNAAEKLKKDAKSKGKPEKDTLDITSGSSYLVNGKGDALSDVNAELRILGKEVTDVVKADKDIAKEDVAILKLMKETLKAAKGDNSDALDAAADSIGEAITDNAKAMGEQFSIKVAVTNDKRFKDKRSGKTLPYLRSERPLMGAKAVFMLDVAKATELRGDSAVANLDMIPSLRDLHEKREDKEVSLKALDKSGIEALCDTVVDICTKADAFQQNADRFKDLSESYYDVAEAMSKLMHKTDADISRATARTVLEMLRTFFGGKQRIYVAFSDHAVKCANAALGYAKKCNDNIKEEDEKDKKDDADKKDDTADNGTTTPAASTGKGKPGWHGMI